MRRCFGNFCALIKLPVLLLVTLVIIEIDVDFAELHRNMQENGIISLDNFHNDPNGTSVWRRRHRIGAPRHDNNSTSTFATDQFQSFFDQWFNKQDDPQSLFAADDDWALEEDDMFILQDSISNSSDYLNEDPDARTSHLRGYLDLIEKGETQYEDEENSDQREQVEKEEQERQNP